MSLIYQPAEDSFLISSIISKYSKNKVVLDMCTGSGILAIEAMKSGASLVTAVDINKDAIKSINLKFKKLKTIESNLFQKIKGKFDLIICNPPYLPEDKLEDKGSRLATTGGKSGDEFILKFIKQSVKHLENSGVILLLLSSLTPRKKIDKLLKKLNLKSKVIKSSKIFFEKLEVLEIRKG